MRFLPFNTFEAKRFSSNSYIRYVYKGIIPVILIVLVAIISLSSYHNTSEPNISELSFPTVLSPTTPYDVDTLAVGKYLKDRKFPEAQRLFEILSWQMFISLNWPRDSHNTAKSAVSDSGQRSWETWKESFEIFKSDGSKPREWGGKTEFPSKTISQITPDMPQNILFRTSKFSAFTSGGIRGNEGVPEDEADEIDQAFTAPIWDQNGNMVRYEIRMNKLDVDYIIKNELYNIDGQISFSNPAKQNKVSFPVADRNTEGSIELKFAWKIMIPGKDFNDRYYTKTASVLEKDGKFHPQTVGLVGMHIGIKTKSSPQWIWATFEQVDDLQTNELALIHGKRIEPSFYDPNCSTCPINLLPDTNSKLIKNQIQRLFPIPLATQELNKEVQSLLNQKNSFMQYYQLIGTQWPTRPNAAPYNIKTNKYTLPDAVTNKSGGNPAPTYLTNMVMETYFQGGSVIKKNLPPKYNKYLGNQPGYFQIQGNPESVDTLNTHATIFGTQSCMGCHYSSSIANGTSKNANNVLITSYTDPGTGDFEWLLKFKAHYKKTGKSINIKSLPKIKV